MPVLRYNLRYLLDLLFEIYYWLLIARIIFPLLHLGHGTHPLLLKLRQFVYTVTEPLLAPLRRVVAPIPLGGYAYLDLSPLILLILLRFVRSVLLRFIL
ncbi:MAG: YggT family protein [Firmicutes bacterium]|nr:YggT family protein [Bacillota bacterium]